MVPPMADIIKFPQKYDPVADLSECVGELCDGLETQVVLSALTTVMIHVVAACIKSEGHAETVRGIATLLEQGIAMAGADDEVTRNH
jgi:hypothetical protein